MRLNALLAEAGIAPEEVAVAFHTPDEPRLRRLLPFIAQRRPDLFDRYQNNHPRGIESTLKARPLLLAFLDIGGGGQILEGLHRVAGWEVWGRARIAADAVFAEIARMIAPAAPEARLDRMAQRAIFELGRDARLAELRGRLVVARPPGRRHVRLAENLDLPLLALFEEPALAGLPPPWRELTLTAAEVRTLPESWAARLREWRGIYLIVDEADGARYVGAAYGADNILGRWQAHAAGDTGVTAELRARDPVTFRFSTLERVSPDMPAEEVTALEATWKDRLHTRAFGLNRN